MIPGLGHAPEVLGPIGLGALIVAALAVAVWWSNRNTRGPRA